MKMLMVWIWGSVMTAISGRILSWLKILRKEGLIDGRTKEKC